VADSPGAPAPEPALLLQHVLALRGDFLQKVHGHNSGNLFQRDVLPRSRDLRQCDPAAESAYPNPGNSSRTSFTRGRSQMAFAPPHRHQLPGRTRDILKRCGGRYDDRLHKGERSYCIRACAQSRSGSAPVAHRALPPAQRESARGCGLAATFRVFRIPNEFFSCTSGRNAVQASSRRHATGSRS